MVLQQRRKPCLPSRWRMFAKTAHSNGQRSLHASSSKGGPQVRTQSGATASVSASSSVTYVTVVRGCRLGGRGEAAVRTLGSVAWRNSTAPTSPSDTLDDGEGSRDKFSDDVRRLAPLNTVPFLTAVPALIAARCSRRVLHTHTHTQEPCRCLLSTGRGQGVLGEAQQQQQQRQQRHQAQESLARNCLPMHRLLEQQQQQRRQAKTTEKRRQNRTNPEEQERNERTNGQQQQQLQQQQQQHQQQQ
eukprot:INCI9336.2.p1 GENE.INCI9336.2~~INCI9336.2.p1  ORF type:complete len:245 (-),score=38.94 INCI9336.2:49-783(-)